MMMECVDLTMAWTRPQGDGRPLFDSVNARFEYGCSTLIAGSTGSGKSTLLHLLGGLLRPTGGEVRDDGRPVSRWTTPHRDRWRRKVGICFQDLHLIPGQTVLEHLLHPLIPRDLSWAAMSKRAGKTAMRLDLDAYLHTPVRCLSGGERQRVAAARAMVHSPEILLLDEPTAFQDDDHAHVLMGLIHAYAGGGACVVVSSHDRRVRSDSRYGRRYRLDGGVLKGAE